ncbi:MAG: aminopeptidase P family protein [Hyphomicrobiales bacterium]
MSETRPFQSYDDTSEPDKGSHRLAQLRSAMAKHNLDGLLVPRTDEHNSEYLPGYAERVAWLTGFTGSNAFVLILPDEARVFSDGRYTLQLRSQTDPAAYTPDDMMETPPAKYLASLDLAGKRIGFDPWLHTVRGFRAFKNAAKKAGGNLVPTSANLIDAIWTDRPERPNEPIIVHPLEFAGQPFEEKIEGIAQTIKEAGADAVILPQADGAAWLFNLRGSDVPQKPMFLAFAIVEADGKASLFVDPGKMTSQAEAQLTTVTIADITYFSAALEALGKAGKSIMIDPANVSVRIADTITDAGGSLIEATDPIEAPRSRKNPTEQAGARTAHVRDGAAITRFLAWFDREAPNGSLDEIKAAEKLLEFRAATNQLKDISFPTISGAGANGAIVHYRVTHATNAPIEMNSLYLVDSGAQYLDGTTDITRTLLVGEPSDEHKRAYTLVLKGHIALATARFPKGTSGMHLDVLARQFLWAHGMDYAHGTGHGVGSYLGVHEGLARIAKQGSVPLEPGMFLSNEPGYYKEGEFGIRLENLVFVTEPEDIGGDQPMMGFETVTRAPFERRLLNLDLMTNAELDWLNDFHANVLADIGPQLSGDDLAFLETACAPIRQPA